MQPHDTRKYLFDIAEACDLIGQFVAGKNFSDYKNDPLLRSGVERPFEIIGEALNQALRYDPALSAKISSTPRIIAFRNQLITGTRSSRTMWYGALLKQTSRCSPGK